MAAPRNLLPCLLAAWALLAGCASDAPRPVDPDVDLYSASGTRRSQAVQLVEASGDQAYVPELIAMLDDEDEAVRMQAHAALRAMTGHDTGYLPFEGRVERAEHIRRWQSWWAARAAGGAGE